MTDLAPSATGLTPVLEHVMVARLHNLDQEILVFDPDPATNSAMEHAAALLSCPDDRRPHHVAALLELLRKMFESNRAEGHCELGAAGVLDPYLKQLHGRGLRSPITVKQAAAGLRAPLQVIRNRPDGVAFFRQACKVRDILDLIDPQVARGAGMRKALGEGSHDTLLSLMVDESDVVA